MVNGMKDWFADMKSNSLVIFYALNFSGNEIYLITTFPVFMLLIVELGASGEKPTAKVKHINLILNAYCLKAFQQEQKNP